MKKKPKKKKNQQSSRKIYIKLLEKAGINTPLEKLIMNIFKISILLGLILSSFLIFKFSLQPNTSILYILFVMFIIWTIAFFGIIMFVGLIFFFIIDLKIYQRKIGIEAVFPDFLQLTSANIRAGMTIDQALWHAIRPNFGVLAKEMEDVAKETMSGTDLEDALYKFGEKYDSTMLQRSIALLIEGLNAGGEIGELLNKISTNIQESKMIQKEMSASVTTYAIFISVASIAGAPFLLALSNQLLGIISKIVSSIEVPESSSAMAISFEAVGVTQGDFRIFALVTLIITSIMSSAIVATIRKGNVKEGAKLIPIFVIVTIMIFFAMDYMLSLFMSDIF